MVVRASNSASPIRFPPQNFTQTVLPEQISEVRRRLGNGARGWRLHRQDFHGIYDNPRPSYPAVMRWAGPKRRHLVIGESLTVARDSHLAGDRQRSLLTF